MVLYHIEYEMKSTGQTFICHCVGTSEKDVIRDIVSQVGEIRVVSIYHQSEVHRITGTLMITTSRVYLSPRIGISPPVRRSPEPGIVAYNLLVLLPKADILGIDNRTCATSCCSGLRSDVKGCLR
jgi:hypothetical protein